MRTYSGTGSFLGVTTFVEPNTSIADSNFNIGHFEARSEFLWNTGEDTPLETGTQTMWVSIATSPVVQMIPVDGESMNGPKIFENKF